MKKPNQPDKEKQESLLIEMMKADEKDGLYEDNLSVTVSGGFEPKSLLYKPKEEQTISLNVKQLPYKKIELLFQSDGGKFGTHEMLAEYKLTPKRLLQILQDRDDYSEDEI